MELKIRTLELYELHEMKARQKCDKIVKSVFRTEGNRLVKIPKCAVSIFALLLRLRMKLFTENESLANNLCFYIIG